MALEDVLVVAPYNMQVNHLRSVLPNGAHVGTVDKFQGQEGEVVIVSMTTSAADDMPRDASFLLSRNRLNVAISRARCLAVLVASPGLLDLVANSVDEMRLANVFCWAAEYSNGLYSPLVRA
jgi:superfamily I DNA and/or RNA helicase